MFSTSCILPILLVFHTNNVLLWLYQSFNLKPAVQTRGPPTNLRVAAILEKANAIRQTVAEVMMILTTMIAGVIHENINLMQSMKMLHAIVVITFLFCY